MKLRLEDNTLRLRLSPEELTEFIHAGRLQTVVPLGPTAADTLTYTLARGPEAAAGSGLQLHYSPGHITVLLPAALSDAWSNTETISLRGQFSVADNQSLHILVEKDLGCKH